MDLHFRDATQEDLQWIVDIYNSTVPGRMVTADTEPVSAASRLAWFNEHEPSFRPLWIASSGDNDIGWISFQSFYGRPAYNATAEISIYLDQRYQRSGFGTEALSHAIQECDRLQIKTLLGYIFAHNLPSIALFRKFGFENWGYFPRIANLDGIERDLVIVGKRIK